MLNKKKTLFGIMAAVLLGLVAGCGNGSETTSPSPKAEEETEHQESAVQQEQKSEQENESSTDYPNKDVSFIIPFAAGGGTDSLMRMVASELEKTTGHAFVINNLPGNGGAVGMAEMLKAEPDGYTIAGTSVYDVLGSAYLGGETVSFSEADFKYVCGVNVAAEVFIANPSTGFETIEDMIQFAQEHPGELTVSTSGNTHNMLLGILEDQLGVKVANIAYSGGGDNFNALMGGHVDVGLLGKQFAAQVEGTDFKVLCAMAPEPLASLPGVPAFCEIYPEVVLAPSCRLIAVSKDTPDEIVSKLEEIVKEATDTEEFRAKMDEAGEEYQFKPGAEVKTSIDEAAKVLKSAVEKNPAAFGLE